MSAVERASVELEAAAGASDLEAMLRACAAVGYRPLLYAELTRAGEIEWVCYPHGEVRAFTTFRGPDPVGVVRQLATWALRFPNIAPTFVDRVMSAFDQRRGACEKSCADYAWGHTCPCVLRGYLAMNRTPVAPPAPAPSGVAHG